MELEETEGDDKYKISWNPIKLKAECKNKTVWDAYIEDNDEYLNIRDTVIQVKINSRLKESDKANKTPKYVATPFPPLNLSHIGKICPKKTINAEICT